MSKPKLKPNETVTDDQPAHSSLVGGSSAEMRIQCTGSYPMQQKLPELPEQSSVYADEGTALHEAIQFCLDNDIVDPMELEGREFYGFVMTAELINEALVPALDFFDALDEEYESEGGLRFVTERKFAFPGIKGAFGTSDITARTDKRTIIIDWKFGAGVPVKAVYIDEGTGEAHNNAQPMFYATAAMNDMPEMFEPENPEWPVDLYIVQPRGRHVDEQGGRIWSMASTTVAGLHDFKHLLIRSIEKGQSNLGQLKKGPWCRFASCKVICPLHTGPMLDLSRLSLKSTKTETVATIDWPTLFAEMLPVADVAEEMIKELRSQAHAYLEAGHQIVDADGEAVYKLVPKRATEHYTDEKGAVRHAIGLGVKPEDTITEPTVKSPAQLRATFLPFMDGDTKKAKDEEAKRQISAFTAKVSSGTTLARAEDYRGEILPTATLLARLADKLGSR